jgi:hypothetical protein
MDGDDDGAISVDEEGSEEEEIDASSVQECSFCHGGGELLLCDTCQQGYHLECCNPPLTRAPRGEWHCNACVKTNKVVSKRKSPRQLYKVW